MNELINAMISEKDILEQLITIDNKKMSESMNYDTLLNQSIEIVKTSDALNSDTNMLFLTDGNPLLTLYILKAIHSSSYKVIIFINQGYMALNKWLIERYHDLANNENHSIDFSINYNKYIGTDYKVIPLGEKEFTDAVLADFS